jgi:hypothetical protein
LDVSATPEIPEIMKAVHFIMWVVNHEIAHPTLLKADRLYQEETKHLQMENHHPALSDKNLPLSLMRDRSPIRWENSKVTSDAYSLMDFSSHSVHVNSRKA